MSSNTRRLGAVVIATAMLGAISSGPVAAAISTDAFCVNVEEGASGFTDIGGVATPQRNDIECLAASKITSGTGPGTYSPSGLVFRDSMATFVAKMVDTANALELRTLAALPSDPPDAFTDDEASVHEANINRLAAAEIVQGKTATTYGPNGDANRVTRAQMATFLVKALEYLTGDDLPAGSNAFPDDNGDTHEPNINKLAGIDVVDGLVDGTYGPNNPVTRTQMASFLIRSLAYLHSQGDISELPPTAQSIALSPSGDVTNGTDAAAGGEVAFTASNIQVADVDLALLPCENVFTTQGAVTFVDGNPDDDMADPGADLVEADIVAVNGTAQAANTEFVSAIPVTNGSITFTVDSPSPDCVHAIVWDDADDDDRLDLDANNRPTEDFGASGRVTFVPPPAPSGPMDENVVSNDESANTFTACELGPAQGPPGAGPAPESGPNAPTLTDCGVFSYDGDNDRFFIDANNDLSGSDGEQVTLAVFEQALSPGDDMAGEYDAAPANQSTFVLVDEAPSAPGGVTAAAVDGDTVNVTFNEVAGADSYKVYFKADPNPLGCPAFTTTGAAPYALGGTAPGGTADADADTTNTVAVNGLSPSTRYCFVATTVDEGDESGGSSAANATTAAVIDNTAPEALDTRLTTNGDDDALIDSDDVIKICFDEDMAATTDGNSLQPDNETLTLQDGNTTAKITNGTNAAFTRLTAEDPDVGPAGNAPCPANRTIRITLTADPAVTAGSAGLSVGANITLSSDIEDLNNNQFTPAGDPDVVVNEEN